MFIFGSFPHSQTASNQRLQTSFKLSFIHRLCNDTDKRCNDATLRSFCRTVLVIDDVIAFA